MRAADEHVMSLDRLEMTGRPLPSAPAAPLDGSASTSHGALARGGEPKATEGPSAFARVLRGMGGELDQGERATRAAIAAGASGRDLSAAELIVLQSQIYRYSEVVDLASKLVDRASNGLRTVVQGQ